MKKYLLVAIVIVTLMSLTLMFTPASASTGSFRWSPLWSAQTPGRVIHLVPEDHSLDGSLQPALNEEAFYWNNSGASIVWDQAVWIPDGACDPTGYEVKGHVRFCYLQESSTENGVARTSKDTPVTLNGCWVTIAPGLYYNSTKSVVGHEMGHCMGLEHSIYDPTSIMYPSAGPAGPNAQDQADLRSMYP